MSDRNDADTPQTLSPAEQIVERFGGIRSMAHKLDVAVSTVQGWKQRKHIPEGRRDEIIKAAKQHDIALESELIDRAIAGEAAAEPAETVKTEAEKAAPATAETGVSPGDAETGKEAKEEKEEAEEAKPAPWPEPSPAAVAQEQAAAPAEAKGGGFLAGMLLGAVILAVGVGAAAVLRDQWLPLVDGGEAAQSQQVRALAERMATLEGKMATSEALRDLQADMATLNQRVESLAEAGSEDGAAALAEEVDALAQQVDGLAAALDAAPGQELQQNLAEVEKRLGDLGQQVSTLAEDAAGTQRVDQLASRTEEIASGLSALEGSLAQLSEQVSQSGANRRKLARDTAADVAVALAIGALRDSLRLGRSFASDLAALNALLPPDSPLMKHSSALAAHADQGVATRAALRRRFEAIANDAVAAAAGGERDDWVGDVLNRLGEVVSVRPVGSEISGDNAGALVAQAEAALQDGDLTSAVAHVTRLTGEPAQIVADWLTAARARLAAEQALSELNVEAMNTLSGRAAGNEG